MRSNEQSASRCQIGGGLFLDFKTNDSIKNQKYSRSLVLCKWEGEYLMELHLNPLLSFVGWDIPEKCGDKDFLIQFWEDNWLEKARCWVVRVGSLAGSAITKDYKGETPPFQAAKRQQKWKQEGGEEREAETKAWIQRRREGSQERNQARFERAKEVLAVGQQWQENPSVFLILNLQEQKIPVSGMPTLRIEVEQVTTFGFSRTVTKTSYYSHNGDFLKWERVTE